MAFQWSGGKDSGLALYQLLGRDDVVVAVDRSFVDALPEGADPCGEHGEYHTFVHDGPIFAAPIDFTLDPPHRLGRDIGTTEGVQRYSYWLATPRPTKAAVMLTT